MNSYTLRFHGMGDFLFSFCGVGEVPVHTQCSQLHAWCWYVSSLTASCFPHVINAESMENSSSSSSNLTKRQLSRYPVGPKIYKLKKLMCRSQFYSFSFYHFIHNVKRSCSCCNTSCIPVILFVKKLSAPLCLKN